MAINHRGSVGLAEKARAAGVKRFVYASSCSTYGAGGDEMRTEESDLAPQTAYAKCKILVENDVRALRDETFIPTFMRNATAYGASPRQRFDIVLNNLCGFAHTIGEIRMTSDGSPWRPIVHIEDICQAMLCVLERRPRGRRRRELQRRLRRRQLPHPRDRRDRRRDLPGLRTDDRRGGRRHPQLPRQLRQDPQAPAGFETAWDAERGARQLKATFDRIGLTREMFEAAPFTRLKELRHLQDTRQVDEKLHWQAMAPV